MDEMLSPPAEARTPGLISVVVPLFNEAESLPTLLERLGEVLDGRDYELVLVDDGSDDATASRIEEASTRDGRVVGLILSRNFGHQYALSAGLAHARGQVVITMDGDLQHPPELIDTLLDRWAEGFNIVQTRRVETLDAPAAKNASSRWYYRFFRWLTGVPLEEGMADFRLLDRRVVEEINHVQEGQLFLRGLIAWMGYRRAVVDFVAPARHAGASKYSFARMCKLASAGMLSFSAAPMRLGIAVGLVMAGLSFLELLFVLIAWLAGHTLPGWASIMALMSGVFGVMFLLMGLQGEYLLKIYQRVQHRPGYLVEKVVGQSPEKMIS